MDKIKGYRTYVLFGAALIVSLLASFGVTPTTEQNDAIGQIVTLVKQIATNPVVLSILAIIMRSITNTAPGSGVPKQPDLPPSR